MKSIDRNWVEQHINDDGTVIIPEGIEIIEPQAFAVNEKVIKVIMPNTVKEIGNKAFCLCKNLREVKFSKGLKSIETSAFSRCSSLEKVDLPDSLEKIGACVFRKCGELKHVNLGNGIKVVDGLSFDGCGLETISGGDSITELDALSFSGTKIENIDIPKNVKKILATALSQNHNLKKVTLNENLEYLSERALEKCDNIEEVVINGTNRINYGAFLKKSSIRKICIDGVEIELSEDEKLFSLQKNKQKAAIVVQDEDGKFSTKAINLQKGTINIIPNNVYLTKEGKPCYAISSLAEISLESLKKIKHSGLNQLYIYGGDNEIMPSEHEKGYEFNLYNVEDLIEIKSKIEEIKKQVKIPPKNENNKQKKIYAQIVRLLSEMVEYDYYCTETSKEKYEKLTHGENYEEYLKKNQNRDIDKANLEDRNLIGLKNGITVCQGNAEIVRNVAAEFGIKVIPVRGKGPENGGHEWNQVYLDGVWYDDDFTYYHSDLAVGKYDRCTGFLMGVMDINGEKTVTGESGYLAYTQINKVGISYSLEDKKFLLNYGRNKEAKSIIDETIKITEEQTKNSEINQQSETIKENRLKNKEQLENNNRDIL